MIPHDQNLTGAEIVELERFLASPPLGETSLDIFGLEGFFAAILLAPSLVMPSRWLGWVWDSREGKVAPEFASFDEAQRMINLVMGFYNMVASHLATDPGVYEPRLEQAGGEEARAWRHGFSVAMRFDPSPGPIWLFPSRSGWKRFCAWALPSMARRRGGATGSPGRATLANRWRGSTICGSAVAGNGRPGVPRITLPLVAKRPRQGLDPTFQARRRDPPSRWDATSFVLAVAAKSTNGVVAPVGCEPAR